MKKEEKLAQIESYIREAYKLSEIAHSNFQQTGLHKHKLEFDSYRDEVKMLALQYAVCSFDLGHEVDNKC